MYRLCIFSILTISSALPTDSIVEPTVEKPNVVKTDCKNGVFSSTCLKIEAISLIDKLNGKEEVYLFPGVTVVREKRDTENLTVDFARHLGGNPYEKIDKYLLFSIGNYLDTHSVKLRLMSEDVTADARNLMDEARGKKKKGGGFGGALALFAAVKGAMLSVAIGGLALLAGKALVAALMSLLLSAIIGIKSISGGQKSTTYEIVSKPVYSHSHSHSTAHEDVGAYGHSGYGRDLKNRRRR